MTVRVLKYIGALLMLPTLSFAQDVNGYAGIKVQRIKFQDVEDAQVYYAIGGSVPTSSNTAVGLEIGVANIDNGTCGFFCRVSVDYTNVELNYKLFAKSRGLSGIMVEAGTGVSLITLSYSVYQRDVRVASRYKNSFGLQAFAAGRYFFPANISANVVPYVGGEIKYQLVESIRAGSQKINLSNLKTGIELGVLF